MGDEDRMKTDRTERVVGIACWLTSLESVIYRNWGYNNVLFLCCSSEYVLKVGRRQSVDKACRGIQYIHLLQSYKSTRTILKYVILKKCLSICNPWKSWPLLRNLQSVLVVCVPSIVILFRSHFFFSSMEKLHNKIASQKIQLNRTNTSDKSLFQISYLVTVLLDWFLVILKFLFLFLSITIVN